MAAVTGFGSIIDGICRLLHNYANYDLEAFSIRSYSCARSSNAARITGSTLALAMSRSRVDDKGLGRLGIADYNVRPSQKLPLLAGWQRSRTPIRRHA